MLHQFFSELVVPGCQIQLGTEKSVLKTVANPVDGELEKFLSLYASNNLYFLGGVNSADAKMKSFRAKDEDILKKNYFYLDLDIRKSSEDLTDEQIKTDITEWAMNVLKELGAPYSSWRYIVFTGNGLHIHYFGEPISVPNKAQWRAGLNDFIDVVEAAFGEKFDRACCNPARIARMPGSVNCKQSPGKPVSILQFCDKKIPLQDILVRGEAAMKRAEEENKKKATEVQAQHPDKQDTYKEIQKIPVGKLMCMLMGWEMEADGKNFNSPGQRDRKGAFVSDKDNFIVHAGTKHLPPNANGYRPFELVKAMKNLDNAGTFEWFKKTYPEIKRISDLNRAGTVEIPVDYSIKSVFQELRTAEVHQLHLGGYWDEWRLLLRGKVTRIGAMPGTGKSKLGYFLADKLIRKEYKGLFFSTEVSSSDVLAHMLQLRLKKPYLDILEHRVEVPTEVEDDFRNLKVFDVRHTGNSLTKIEQIIKRERDRGEANSMRGIDFIVIDWSQQVTPKSGRYTDIFSWATEWGNQCQEIAQKYDIAFIDVCQLSIKGNKDEDESHGHIPYEGGNKLVQTADIATMISRDKSSIQTNNQVIWDVRKSKAMGRRFRMEMDYDWNSGEFTLTGAQDSRSEPGESGYHNYKVQ